MQHTVDALHGSIEPAARSRLLRAGVFVRNAPGRLVAAISGTGRRGLPGDPGGIPEPPTQGFPAHLHAEEIIQPATAYFAASSFPAQRQLPVAPARVTHRRRGQPARSRATGRMSNLSFLQTGATNRRSDASSRPHATEDSNRLCEKSPADRHLTAPTRRRRRRTVTRKVLNGPPTRNRHEVAAVLSRLRETFRHSNACALRMPRGSRRGNCRETRASGTATGSGLLALTRAGRRSLWTIL